MLHWNVVFIHPMFPPNLHGILCWPVRVIWPIWLQLWCYEAVCLYVMNRKLSLNDPTPRWARNKHKTVLTQEVSCDIYTKSLGLGAYLGLLGVIWPFSIYMCISETILYTTHISISIYTDNSNKNSLNYYCTASLNDPEVLLIWGSAMFFSL